MNIQSMKTIILSSFLSWTMLHLASAWASLSVAVGQNHTGSSPALLVDSMNQGVSWKVQSILGLPKNSAFHGVTCHGSVCLAVGGNFTTTPHSPLIARGIEQNHQMFWSAKPLSLSLSSMAVLSDVNCVGSFCVAVGGGEEGSDDAGLILQSHDQGISWSRMMIPDFHANGPLNAVSCTENRCVAVGGDGRAFNSQGAPQLVETVDQGHHWHEVSIPNLPAKGVFNTVYCDHTLCIAAGDDLTTHTALLVETQDDGVTWQRLQSISFPSLTFFQNASCSGNHCLVVGTTEHFDQALMIESLDRGMTWRMVNEIPQQAVLYGASCSNACCYASGFSFSDATPQSWIPLVDRGCVKSDGQVEWAARSLPTVNGRFVKVTCQDQFCMAAGDVISGFQPPLLAVSHDAGESWSVMDAIPHMPKSGAFFSTFLSDSIKRIRVEQML